MKRSLYSRLDALEAAPAFSTEPTKSPLPEWLMEEMRQQGMEFDVVFGYPSGSQNCPGNPLPASVFGLTSECGGEGPAGAPVICKPTLYSDPASPQEDSVTATLTFQSAIETEPNPAMPNVGPFSCMATNIKEGSTGVLSPANCPCPCYSGATTQLTFNPASPIFVGTSTAISPPSGFTDVSGTSAYSSSNPSAVTLSNTKANGVAVGSSFISSSGMVYSPTSGYVATGCSLAPTRLDVVCAGSSNFTCANEGYPVCSSQSHSWVCSNGDAPCVTPPPLGCSGGTSNTSNEWVCEANGWQCVTISTSGTPILIDTKGEGFHLTDVAHGVPFTFFPNKPAVQISWTDPKYSNAWLALDRNGNGKIDDGAELFGNLTAQPSSATPNGYLALAVFDDPANGGNGNGMIDPGDGVFDKLLVWIDSNHDGISQPSELHSLREVGVFIISLHYTSSPYVDQFGNKFRYRSQILDEAGIAHDRCYDVFL